MPLTATACRSSRSRSSVRSRTSRTTYTAAEQIADFGAVQPSLTVRIAQLSATYGRGSPATAVV